MSEAWTKVKDFVAKWYLIGSSLAIAILVILFQRRGTKIKDLQFQIQRDKLGAQLKEINDKEIADEKAFQQSRDAYLTLKRRHPEHFPSDV